MNAFFLNENGDVAVDGESGSFLADGSVASAGCGAARRSGGFTLMELMITVVIIAILAAIAWPIYTKYITKTRRVAAEGCLSEYANYMERYYTTHLRYNDDGATPPVPNTKALANLDCSGNAQTGRFYNYDFPSTSLTVSSYLVTAAPKDSQATNDASCGTLSIDQKGARGDDSSVSGSCWR
ncbi:type IV pilin protein [Rhodanobacter sp. AS-Z3]|uniref:type IV pilin protein n=1 Tax=Rhodanobacter sp. AS-Z3 TaxID=3031330 RepID=UPI00247A634A|nr:type IV pilin protein [Rhodanobacter sp. AS-Z3]WEN16699.1 type IV pilin protein [Rhodanobacter sp. AS-Z3]